MSSDFMQFNHFGFPTSGAIAHPKKVLRKFLNAHQDDTPGKNRTQGQANF